MSTATTEAGQGTIRLETSIALNSEAMQNPPTGAVPVVLRVGRSPSRSFVIGHLPDPGTVDVDSLVEALADDARRLVPHTASRIRCVMDIERLAAYAPELLEAVRTVGPRGDSLGPVVRVLRQKQGMSRAALARAIGRDRGMLAAFEGGGFTRTNLADLHRIGDVLGYSSAALMEFADMLLKRARA